MPTCDSTYIQTAEIWFIISKDGSIRIFKCNNSNSINTGLKNEALRLIKESPLWIPSQRNGRNMNTYKKEKISITVSPQYL